jgi:hypothetical protein
MKKARKWTPEENDSILNMIDNVVSHDVWAIGKDEEKPVNRSNEDKKSWTAIVCLHASKLEVVADDVSSS